MNKSSITSRVHVALSGIASNNIKLMDIARACYANEAKLTEFADAINSAPERDRLAASGSVKTVITQISKLARADGPESLCLRGSAENGVYVAAVKKGSRNKAKSSKPDYKSESENAQVFLRNLGFSAEVVASILAGKVKKPGIPHYRTMVDSMPARVLVAAAKPSRAKSRKVA